MELMFPTENPYTLEKVYYRKDVVQRQRGGWSRVSVQKLGERLKLIRERLKLTQAEMVEVINERCRPHISTNLRQYQRWERGNSLKRILDPDILLQLSQAFHVPFNFLTGTSDRIPALWKANSPLTSPEKALSSRIAPRAELKLYKVVAHYRAMTRPFYVYADSRYSARKLFIEGVQGAQVVSLRKVPVVPGVIM